MFRLKDHINKHHPKEVLSLDEFLSLRQEVLKERAGDVAPGDDEAPPGEEEAPPGETSPTELSKDKDSAGGDAAAAAKAAVSKFFAIVRNVMYVFLLLFIVFLKFCALSWYLKPQSWYLTVCCC